MVAGAGYEPASSVATSKDLELAMTVGEIARQVHEFRGENLNGKPDRLKKRMNRIDLLSSRIVNVRRFTKSPASAQIEMCLVFSDLVPMNFTNLARERDVRIVLADALDAIQVKLAYLQMPFHDGGHGARSDSSAESRS